jgi:hypothetical protein
MYAVTFDSDGYATGARGVPRESDCFSWERPYDGTFERIPDGTENGAIALVLDGETIRPFNAEERAEREKRALLKRVAERKAQEERDGFVVNGRKFYSNEEAFYRLIGAALAAVIATITNQPFPSIPWESADGDDVMLDRNGVIGLFMAFVQHGIAIHSHATDLIRRINAGEKPNIDGGWPGGPVTSE